MLIKPIQLGRQALPAAQLAADCKACRRFGPCGVGQKAIYLNSFYIDRRYYITYDSITRVFKRVAMSKGGFTQKGIFASMPYLVVEYDGGKQKQCNFKYEQQVDQLLEYLGQQQPGIKLVSEAAEQRLAERERERAARKKAQLSPAAHKSLAALERAIAYLQTQPALAKELSAAAGRKRGYLRTSPSYRWAALAITLLGVAALVFGVAMLAAGRGSFGVYFALFGLAAVFLFSGASVLPTGRNNRTAVMRRVQRAQQAMQSYLQGYGRPFPVPTYYAHPVVLRRMQRAIEEGRAEQLPQALEVVKQDLKALNASVEVDQEEYDEVIAVKPLFLNEDYR